MTKLAWVISKQEGALITGSIPQRRNNPGDLRHSPNCQHTVFCAFREDADGEITDGPHKGKFYKNPLVLDPVTKEIIGPDDVGLIDTLEHGQQDLDRQLQLIAARMITVDPVTHLPVTPRKPTVRDCIYTWAPPSENNSASYLNFVLNEFGGQIDAETPLSQALEIQSTDFISIS